MYMYYLYTNDIELIVYEVQQCGVDVLFRQKFDENLKIAYRRYACTLLQLMKQKYKD